MLCSNYNVYIIWYLHIMVSTYYIYYIVTTYYVVNGINILDYLHNDNVDNGGHGLTMSPLCATGKWGLLCVCTPCYAAHHASYALLARATGTARANYARESACGHRLGLGLVRCVPHSPFPPKKICVFWYAWFTRMEIAVPKALGNGTVGLRLCQSPAV